MVFAPPALARAAQSRTLNSYHSLGLISGIGFGVGLAGAATGILLLSYGGGKKAEKSASSHSIHLQIAPGTLQVRGAF